MFSHIFSKKPVLVVIFIFCSLIPLAAQVLNAGLTIGDVNEDRKIDIIDAFETARYVTGISTQELFLPVADPSNDEQVGIVDALLIAQYSAGLVTTFPRQDPINIVRSWAAAQKIDLTGYMLALIGSKETATMFPGYAFVRINIREYPVAYGNPDPLLGLHSIAAVKADSSVEICKDETVLTQFYKVHQRVIPSTTPADAYLKLVMKAWLTLSQELKNDGFYTFAIPDDSLSILPTDSYQVSGTSEVVAGGSGAIRAVAYFDNSFFLVRVSEEVSLVPGVRPICQSTKLLDKDPIVRKMAEQDLLTMGASCFDYLAVQRAKASPELKRAIDRIREQILNREVQLKKIRSMLGH